MATTFQKRQKEMKRMEKAKQKAERRAQKKLEPRDGNQIATDNGWDDVPVDDEQIHAQLNADPYLKQQ